MKDFFDYQGGAELITGSRNETKEAFNKGLISNGDMWMEMIKSRNKTSHTYQMAIAQEISDKIKNNNFELFQVFHKIMTDRLK
jgi:nucleotidyltransferase substrate binding protein (TIGR01987 family)